MARFRRLSDLNDPLPFVDTRWQYLLPEAPTAVTAVGGNGQATVSWTAPASIVDITDYYVQFQPSGGGWSTFSDGVSTGTSATVTGLTNGTAYTFRVAAVSGIGQGAWSTASIAVTPQAGDPLFSQVALLLHMDGSGSTFVDSSKYARTQQALGDAAQSSAQSKFGGKSAYFSGSAALNTGLPFNSSTFGTQDFVIEGWFYVTSASNFNWLMAARDGNITGGIHLVFYSGTWKAEWSLDGGSWQRIDNLAVPSNQWFHYALVRNGSTLTAYINGTSQGSASVGSSTFYGDSGGITLFSSGSSLGSGASGYADEFRVTIGSNRGYTSNFTPPAAAFPEAISGTDPWIANVALLLHMDGSGSTFVDSSPSPKAITAFGNATQSAAQSKWGGKSLALDGSGDYLKTASNSAFAFGTGDFCVELWINPSASASQNYGRLIQCGNFPAAGGWQLARGTAAGGGSSNPIALLLDFTDGSSSSFRLEGGTLTDGQWSHVALSRSSGTVSLYVNGTRVATGSSSQNLTQSTIVIGDSDGGGSAIAGYIDDVRITTGSNRGYAGATITVPTAAFPDS